MLASPLAQEKMSNGCRLELENQEPLEERTNSPAHEQYKKTELPIGGGLDSAPHDSAEAEFPNGSGLESKDIVRKL